MNPFEADSDEIQEPGSYRDREARVFFAGGAVFRALSPQGLSDWKLLQNSALFQRLSTEQKIVKTWLSDAHPAPAGWAGVVQHERVENLSYPYEWSFSMLRDAALLHLEILESAIDEGMILKDATPFNVQWRGARPLFIDTSSFTSFDEGDLWKGYRQFCELFLNPLLLYAYKGIDFHPWLRGNIDGIPVQDCAALMSTRDLLRPGVAKHVTLHSTALKMISTPSTSISSGVASSSVRTSPLILKNIRSLRKVLDRLQSGRSSTWTGYSDQNTYSRESTEKKERFLCNALSASNRSKLIIDFGCNTGFFSRVAADFSEYVVAIDTDHASVERLYRDLQGHEKILPLVFDIVNPSPGLGWRRKERVPLEDRMRPDTVLALALIHHLVIGRNVPLPEVIDYLASFRCEVVVEWVSRKDPMVEALLLQKGEPFHDYDFDSFQSTVRQKFEVVSSEEISTTRSLYHLLPRS